MATKGFEYKTRRAVQIAVAVNTKWPDYIPRVESTRLLATDGINLSMFRMARRLVKSGRQDLIDKVLGGSLSLHKAEETVTKGDRVKCIHCEGRGYVFKLDGNRKITSK
jgi:hypothetical protein